MAVIRTCLFVMLAIFTAWGGGCQRAMSPSDVVREHLEASKVADYKAAFALFTSDVRAPGEEEQYIEFQKQREAERGRVVSYTIEGEKPVGDTVEVAATVMRANGVTWRGVLVMIKENGQWRIKKIIATP
ncbi:MAG: DUF4878 domain-containing protein [Chloroflexi bacterium]|nr:DUF4878 domain-containing protein [Chloroflexota bacterium]MCL5074115.1 DUF4878 domain-containing protein [Chloroflexota bacterium]